MKNKENHEEKDDLERFVFSNRDDFDSLEPSDALWDKIKPVVPVQETKPAKRSIKMVPLRMVVGVAAAFAILFSAGMMYMYNNSGLKSVELTVNELPEPQVEEVELSLRHVSPEMAEIEDYYITQVDNKMTRLQELNLDPEILNDIEFLDDEFKALQAEMGTSVDNEKIIEAMIDNYRLKLDILEDILENLETGNSEITNEIDEDEENITVYY